VDRSINSEKVVGLLDWLFLAFGTPQHLRNDNGPELVAGKVQDWLAERNRQTIYITPGSPWENASIESFFGKLRKECLDRYLFFTLRETRNIIETWRDEYIHHLPPLLPSHEFGTYRQPRGNLLPALGEG